MEKIRINNKGIENLLKRVFPRMELKKTEKFSKGLTSGLVLKIKINNPNITLVLKLSKLKRKSETDKNNKILRYLNKNEIPSPKIFYSGIYNKKIATVMEYAEGDIAGEIYAHGNQKLRKNILKNAGKILRRIHNLNAPPFWIHQHHEIKNASEWKRWTENRVKKYLIFSEENLSEFYETLKKELEDFWRVLDRTKIKLVPLHWDYHLYNLNVDYHGEITGVFDFDNSMKGHNLADLGQTAYWIRFQLKDKKNIENFLTGYKKNFSKEELKMIQGYLILHLLAVSRTIWRKQKRLKWILKEHKKILKEMLKK